MVLFSILAAFPFTALPADAPKLKIDNTPISRGGAVTTSYAPLIGKVAPSVVSVYTRKTVRAPKLPQAFQEDPLLRRFFGFGGEDVPQEEEGLGSGVIVTEDGYILTNNHVVDGADEIKVATADGAEYTAKLVGTDPPTDVAVIKIDKKDLPAATLADSGVLQVGDIVLAIGNPFGVGQTVTSGIVSGTRRSGLGITEYEDFIQTDASINPGNSGGPLVDSMGRVIGLNTAIFSRTGGSMGIGFAVPINLARNDLVQIITQGRVTRAQLGVAVQPMTPDLAKAFKAPSSKGALVSSVKSGSSATRAGVEEGDVITKVNDTLVENSRGLRMLIAQMKPGAEVKLTVIRKGEEKTLTAKLDEAPMQTAKAGQASPEEPQPRDALQGVELQNLDQALRRELKVPSGIKGAVVSSVEETSPAYRAGLRTGDVILDVDHNKVSTAKEAESALEKAKGSVLLRVWSQDGTHFLVVPGKEGP
jgi:serine protease Do